MAKRKTKASTEKAQPKAAPGDYGIIRKAVITEKSSLIGGTGSKVVFKVRDDATKDEIRRAVERVFNVKVATVRTLNMMGKPKRTRGSVGRRAGYRKAYVTLAEGQTIDLIEGL